MAALAYPQTAILCDAWRIRVMALTARRATFVRYSRKRGRNMKRNLRMALVGAVLIGGAATSVFAQPYDSRMRTPAQKYNGPAISGYDIVDCIAGFAREDGESGSYVCRSAPVRCGRGYSLAQVQSQGSGPGFNPQDTPSATYASGRFQYECRVIPQAPR